MKVICISSGNQKEDAKVHVGSEYTVIDFCYGWELMTERTSDMYYQLLEMPKDVRYWYGLFSLLNDEQEIEVKAATAEK